jgi:hypothetical protein
MKPAAEVINDTIDPDETPRIMKAIPVHPSASPSKLSVPATGKNQNGPQPFSLQKQTQKGKKE